MAKNVKSVVNINEVVKNKEAMELKAAKQENEQLRDKIMQLEAKIKDIGKPIESRARNTPYSTPQLTSKRQFQSAKCDIREEDMEVDGKNENSHNSSGTSMNTTIGKVHKLNI